MVGKTALPDQVPYLNRRDDFFVGNGIAGGGGAGDGRWDFLVGPDYTCPNYLNNEEFKLVVDGEPQLVNVNMHRARNTGIFYGLGRIGDLEVCLIDYAAHGQPWTARLVILKNKSPAKAHNVSVQAVVAPISGAGRSATIVKDSGGSISGISLRLDTTLNCMVNRFCRNWSNRYAVVAFDERAAAVSRKGDVFVLDAAARRLAPGASRNVALYHYMHYGDVADADCINRIRERNPLSDVETCIHQWQDWFADVDAKYSLDHITDQRARNIVEGGLAILKMNQCRDGGIVAQERGWNMCYVRDAYCALRGLGACGHFDELKRFIQWLDHKYSVHGFIPNAAPGGSDTYAHPSGNTGGPCPEANAAVEVTALYLLAARDYFDATHDLRTLTNADKSLRYAMDAQLKQALANGYRLEFNGDETELSAGDVGVTGFDGKLSRYWSMSSVALCSASLEFYIRYLTEKGADPTAYTNSLDNRTLNLNEVLDKLKDALEADFWRTNVPECPAGFHDAFRVKSDGSWPRARIVNFTLFPLYYGTPLKYPKRASADVAAVAQYFNPNTGLLPLTAVADGRSLGHDLGYLLWGLVAVGNPRKTDVYDALVNGHTVGCWGSYHESYGADGLPPKGNGLRSLETGVNLNAIARYWGLGPHKAASFPSVAQAFPPGTWVTIDDNHSAITYSGNWAYSSTSQGYYLTTCHFSSHAGDSVKFTFDGTGIRWIGGKNNDHGNAAVYLDGILQTKLNTRTPSWLRQQLLFEKTGLSDGRHTIRIVVLSGGNQDVDSFEYRAGKTPP